ncbi:MAG: hypothetical protein Q6373_014120 [Candidatus Sigynarchaeota archaeon]
MIQLNALASVYPTIMVDEVSLPMAELLEIEANDLGLPDDPVASLFWQPERLILLPKLIEWVVVPFPVLVARPLPIADVVLFTMAFMEEALKLQRVKPIDTIKELRDSPCYLIHKEKMMNDFYFFSPTAKLLISITEKTAGFVYDKASNHVFCIDIFTSNEQLPRDLARFINSRYKQGIMAQTDWSKVEKAFDVSKEECIQTWNGLLCD